MIFIGRTCGSSLCFLFNYLFYQSVVLLGRWEDEGMVGEATKGCKLIRFLSLHAPLPVLLLSNPGGQRCAAQRLDSQTQWGNNWYKRHSLPKLYQSFQVTQFLLFLQPPLLSAGFIKLLFLALFLLFIPPSYLSFLWIFTFLSATE